VNSLMNGETTDIIGLSVLVNGEGVNKPVLGKEILFSLV